ncbi:protein SOK1 [Diplogelasinospora grovesii]|uniref:Protein SOK1 n=1 Tax=Diplogelasinospora grovesii TaxID=303347 RepID=A0AAN6NG80_9PEZI|nr:protein SOK1 [Diplogelasinospora grovesii]
MGDQGAGGGIESHMPTHRRQESGGEDPTPAEKAPETRNPPPETDNSDQFSQPLQDLLRGSRKLEEEVGSNRGTPVSEVAPGLSRNPSTCSTTSSAKPQNEYLTAQADRRPSPLSRHSMGTAPTQPLEPPVTKATLSELDVHKIIHNPKLRHDINFDPELHYRPNLDGEKGKKKLEKANQFWNTLQDQLVQFVVDREGFYARYGHDDDWCLPSLLRAVKEIIQTLVPQRDRDQLNEGLDVDLLMQQFNRGIADLEGLATWLSRVLKRHCAPMRDDWVDEMYHELSNGNANNNMAELVKGMRSLLSVLEAMKLDVANHQIRCLRPVLIEDTVDFEQRFFKKKCQQGKVNIRAARAWYIDAQQLSELEYGTPEAMPHLSAFGETAVFFEALSRLILPSTSTVTVPTSFVFDEERILKLRSDMYDSICLEICMRKYEDLERLSTVSQLYARVPSFVGDECARSARSSGEFNFNAPPSPSRPSSFAFSDRGSTTPSPRNSGGLFAQPAVDFAESRSKSLSLYNSLLALLHNPLANNPPQSNAQRWQALASSMALQILRYANAPLSTLPGFESQLAAWLRNVHGDVFREVELHFKQRLLADLAKRVKEFKNLNGVALFSVATGGRINGPGRAWDGGRERDQAQAAGLFGGMAASEPRDARDEAGVEDMATRLAHLGILHWRVWAPAYVGDIENEANYWMEEVTM